MYSVLRHAPPFFLLSCYALLYVHRYLLCWTCSNCHGKSLVVTDAFFGFHLACRTAPYSFRALPQTREEGSLRSKHYEV